MLTVGALLVALLLDHYTDDGGKFRRRKNFFKKAKGRLVLVSAILGLCSALYEWRKDSEDDQKSLETSVSLTNASSPWFVFATSNLKLALAGWCCIFYNFSTELSFQMTSNETKS